MNDCLYDEAFFYLEAPEAQCIAWSVFTACIAGDFSSVEVHGSEDPIGVICSDPEAATAICSSVRDGVSAAVVCGEHVWQTGVCAGSASVAVDADPCSCSTKGRALRACVDVPDWGGMLTLTCKAPSQTLSMSCIR